jgi:N-acyl-L-homoserine lactone synthetase
LKSDFVVDHVIPFSLWANNDLWNLLPADKQVNGQKSDRLPSAELVLSSRERIICSWRLLRDATPEAFTRQAEHLLGTTVPRGTAWEGQLFGCLREAIEVTALQRGVERWRPSA